MSRTASPQCGSRAAQSGQALPEFALLAPLLFLMLFGVIQLGFTLSGHIGLTNATREAARYAATVPNTTTAAVLAELTDRQMPKAIPGFVASNVILGAAGSDAFYCAEENANHDPATFPSYSIRVRVNAVYGHPMLIPFVGQLLDAFDGVADNALTARVTEEMRVENPRLTSDGGLTGC